MVLRVFTIIYKALSYEHRHLFNFIEKYYKKMHMTSTYLKYFILESTGQFTY